MTDTVAPRTFQQEAEARGIDFTGFEKYHAMLNEDGPLEITLADFQPYMPLFQTSAQLSDAERKRLSSEYLPMIQWGYRPVHVTALDSQGVKQVVLKLPRIFVRTTTPGTPEYSVLAAINSNTNYNSDRQDLRSAAEQAYMTAFMQSQDNTVVVESIRTASAETDQILIDFVRSTKGPEAIEEVMNKAAPVNKTTWDFEE